MKKLYATIDKALLELLKSKLADDGIATIIKNENPPAVGEVTPIVAWPELWVVDDQDFQKADRFVQQELKKLEVSKTQASWTCSQCGEQVEPQFDVCWKCGQSR